MLAAPPCRSYSLLQPRNDGPACLCTKSTWVEVCGSTICHKHAQICNKVPYLPGNRTSIKCLFASWPETCSPLSQLRLSADVSTVQHNWLVTSKGHFLTMPRAALWQTRDYTEKWGPVTMQTWSAYTIAWRVLLAIWDAARYRLANSQAERQVELLQKASSWRHRSKRSCPVQAGWLTPTKVRHGWSLRSKLCNNEILSHIILY